MDAKEIVAQIVAEINSGTYKNEVVEAMLRELALAWLASSTASADIRLAAGWDLPALKDLNALSSYLEITPPDNREAVFESLNYLVMPPVIEDYALMSDIITQKLAAAAEGTITVQEALDQAQAECEAQIKLG